MDIRIKFGDYMLNSGLIIRLFAPVLRTFVLYLIAFCSRPEPASEVISGRFIALTFPNPRVKFRDPRL